MRHRTQLAVLAAGALDLGLEQSIIVPALPGIQEEHGAGVSETTLLVSVYLLAWVISTPVLARLGDLHGNRRVLILALGLVAAGSIVCAIAESMPLLILGRAIQGAGGAIGPLTVGLLRHSMPRDRLPSAIGAVTVAAVVGYAAGLMVGGVIVERASVAALFWVLAAIAAALALATVLLIPRDTPDRGRPGVDWPGAAVLAVGLSLALAAVTALGSLGSSPWLAPGLGVLSLAALALLVRIERRRDDPLLDLRALSTRAAMGATVAAFGIGVSFFVAAVVVPRMVMQPVDAPAGLGYGPVQAGLLLAVSSIAAVAGAWSSARSGGRLGVRRLVVAGATLSGAGYLVMALGPSGVTSLVVGLAIQGTGLGLALPAIITLAAIAAPAGTATVAVAMQGIMRSLGAALGAQLAAAIIAGAALAGLAGLSGYATALLMAAIASLLVVPLALVVPSRSADPTTLAAAQA